MKRSVVALVRPLTVVLIVLGILMGDFIDQEWRIQASNRRRGLRELAARCIRNVYATVDSVQQLPPVTRSSALPSYISLCREWIKQDAIANMSSSGGGADMSTYRVIEDEVNCLDWSAPHFQILDIHAALLVSHQVKNVDYRPTCERTRIYHDDKKQSSAAPNFDWTTVQQALGSSSLGINKHIMSPEKLKAQCRRCLLGYDPHYEQTRETFKAVHHCLLFPQDTSRKLNVHQIPLSPTKSMTNTAPISAIVNSLRNRIHRLALEWQNVTDAPPLEDKSGVVIYLDPTSIGIKYEELEAEIEHPVTSISILAGPKCATMYLPTGQLCRHYAHNLARHLQRQQYNKKRYNYQDIYASTIHQVDGSSSNNSIEIGVSFQIVASTAAAYSRMILAQQLLCPPRTISCLIPALSKRADLTRARVLDDVSWMKAIDFYTLTGTQGVVKVKLLKEIPTLFLSPERGRVFRRRIRQGEIFVDDEGYPSEQELGLDIWTSGNSTTTDQAVLSRSANLLDTTNHNNPNNMHQERQEVVPTKGQVRQALAKNVALNLNTRLLIGAPVGKNGGGEGIHRYRHGELATDADMGVGGVGTKTIDPAFWIDASNRRHESLLRIQHEWDVVLYENIQYSPEDPDPSILHEFKCDAGVHGRTLWERDLAVKSDGSTKQFPFTKELYRVCQEFKTRRNYRYIVRP